jgi:methylmalonyl-CoA mutase cobalamin-binding subunit
VAGSWGSGSKFIVASINQGKNEDVGETMVRKARNRDLGHDMLLDGKWKPPDEPKQFPHCIVTVNPISTIFNYSLKNHFHYIR